MLLGGVVVPLPKPVLIIFRLVTNLVLEVAGGGGGCVGDFLSSAATDRLNIFNGGASGRIFAPFAAAYSASSCDNKNKNNEKFSTQNICWYLS